MKPEARILTCMVPGCRTTKRHRGNGAQWVCQPHWIQIPLKFRKAWRNLDRRVFRQDGRPRAEPPVDEKLIEEYTRAWEDCVRYLAEKHLRGELK